MKKSFSPHWDRLVRRAIRERKPELLLRGREIEVTTMGLVLFPERIQQFWDERRYDELAYLAEYIRAGVPADLEQTDRVLFRNLTDGMVVIRKLVWDRDRRLRPGPLRIRAAAQRRRNAAAKAVRSK